MHVLLLLCVLILAGIPLWKRVIEAVLKRRISTWVHQHTSQRIPAEEPSFPYGNLDGKTFIGRELSLKHRSLTYVIWSFMEPILVIGSPEAAQDFYKRKNYLHPRDPDEGLGYLAETLLGNCLGVMYGERWLKFKRYFSEVFGEDNIQHFQRVVEPEVQSWIQKYVEDPAPKEVNLSTLAIIPFNMVVQLLYGALTPYDLITLRDLQHRHDFLINKISTFTKRFGRILKHLPTPTNQVLDQFARQWSAFNLDRIEKAQLTQEISSGTINLIGYLAHNQSALEDIKTDPTWFLHTLDEILFTNVEISHAALSWAVYLVATHPHVQVRLRKELRQSDNKDCEYLHWVLLECARYSPSVALTLPERTYEDMIIGGYLIPANTAVCVDVDTLNHNSDWEDPFTFNPMRFANSKNINSYMFHQYGLGSRRCLGFRLANKMLKVLLSQLVQNYEFWPATQQSPQLKSDGLPFFSPFTEFAPVVFKALHL